MTLRGLPTAVCLVAVLSIGAAVLAAWSAAGGASAPGADAVGGSSSGIIGIGIDAGSDPSGAISLQGDGRPYALRAIYFRRDRFKSAADCLTAASTQRLPLEVCQ